MWTLNNGLIYLRFIEEIIKPLGLHCGLGGSVLHSGHSEHDLDILIYPHSTYDNSYSSESIFKIIQHKLGFADGGKCNPGTYNRTVYWLKNDDGQKIDLFFFESKTEPQIPGVASNDMDVPF